MAREASPAYQWYVKDWRSSRATMRMTFAERGVYREMLDQQWEDRMLPDDPHAVAELIATTEAHAAEVIAAWPVVRRKFATVESQPGFIQNIRLEQGRREKRRFQREKQHAGLVNAATAVRGPDGTFQQRTISRPSAVHQPSITPQECSPSPIHPSSSSSSSSSTASASAVLGERARRLLEELYPAWYSQWRHGAKLRRGLTHNSMELQDALSLVQTWDDARLEKLAKIVLITDADEFIVNSDRGFKIFATKASWADDRLRQQEARAS